MRIPLLYRIEVKLIIHLLLAFFILSFLSCGKKKKSTDDNEKLIGQNISSEADDNSLNFKD